VSKFFKALEQAELDRALREPGLPKPPGIRRAEPEPASELPTGPRDGVEQHLVSLLTPASFEAEQYRALRHLVEHLRKTANLCIVAVSSPSVKEGKTTTAINLAGALSQAPDARVLLIDADLRQSSLMDFLGFGGSGGHGLVDAILHPHLTLDDVVQDCPPFNLSVLSAGRRPSAPYEILKSPRLGELLAEARRRYDYIVLDTPPVLHVPDCRVIGKWVDGFLMVVDAHHTPQKLVDEALKLLDPTKVVGLVFNRDDHPISEPYHAYHGAREGDGTQWWGRTVKQVGASLLGRSGRFGTRRASER